MVRGKLIAIGVVAMLLAAGTTAFVMRTARPPLHDEELKIIPAPAAMLGADQAFCWSYPTPPDTYFDDHHILRIVFREIEQPLPPNGGSVAISSQSVAAPSAVANREFGAGGAVLSSGAKYLDPRIALVQLLDLRDTGVSSTRPGQDLRVVAKIKFGGTSGGLLENDIFLPTGTFSGTSWQQSGRWVNDELYLMSFYVRGATSLFKYDVLLKASRV